MKQRARSTGYFQRIFCAAGRAQRAGRAGMSLVEVMISLAISSTLLIAVSAAFQTSANTVDNNDAYFRCSQAARVTMVQMLTEMRRADSVQVDPANKYVQVIRPTDELSPNEIYRQFTYDATNKRITLQIFYSGNTSSPVYEMTSNVTSASFGPPATITGPNNSQIVIRVPVTITCTTRGNTVTLSGAAAPRRAQTF